ncbi:MAG: right-handed parallel beta-helix repeat-containing protein [Dehalococcoidia bacterium]|nr:right-handed parallel beta-helix repeat-containing protein [Dehalococcoidia bacterium]
MTRTLPLAALAALLLVLAGGSARPALAATTLTVTRSDDPAPDGCATNGCTLREAMLEAQAGDTIAFAIPGAGPHVIQPSTALPNLGGGITIDGYTQSGASPNTSAAWEGGNAVLQVVLDGGLIPDSQEASGILISGRDVRIRGLAIRGFDQEGVYVSGFGSAVIQGNYIGEGGGAPAGNGTSGIWINSDHAGNVAGGASPADRNVVSGNGGAGLLVTGAGAVSVLGNFIGTDPAGAEAAPNGGAGIDLRGGPNSTIGGAGPGAGNLLSGNAAEGLRMSANSPGSGVFGNRIGTDAEGRLAVPNQGPGMTIGAAGVAIGGAAPGAGNIVSGNAGPGIVLAGADAANMNLRANLIGTKAGGSAPLGNGGHGVFLDQGAHDDTIGAEDPASQNTIAFNGGDGVALSASAGLNNYIDPNVTHSNEGLGTDLLDDGLTGNDEKDTDSGPNDLQNFPVLTSATGGSQVTVEGTLNSTPNRAFNLFFFSNLECDPSGYGEGRTFLGQTVVVTSTTGDAAFVRKLPSAVPPGQFITATASNPESSSEFSLCLAVSPPLIRHGDIRCDGVISMGDAVGLLRRLGGVRAALPGGACPGAGSPVDSPDSIVRLWGDIDCDGVLTARDPLQLLRYRTGLSVSLAPGCPAIGSPITVSESLRGGVLATFLVVDEQFRVWVTNAAIGQLFDLQAGRSSASIPAGRIVAGPGQAGHNAPWSWHLDPEQVQMAEVTIEVCDARPSYVEENLGYFLDTLGTYCPWSAQLASLVDYR